MSKQAKLKKMLEILLLLDCNYGRTISEISRRFELSKRTVYRYFDTFKQVEFIIENNNSYFKIDKLFDVLNSDDTYERRAEIIRNKMNNDDNSLLSE